ncbi:MAG: allophanate hydrolase-related protein [Enterobacteriaceae bacterium]
MKKEYILLAVNGTLMRGLELNPNLLNVGAEFVQEAQTAPCYRIWSIDDRHPAMIRTPGEGGSVALEIWRVPAEGVAQILLNEPAGLSIGKVLLSDQQEVLGVLGEPFLCANRREITALGGWRDYLASRGLDPATGKETTL